MANAAGTVIASTRPELRGREIGDREWQQAARRGDPWVGLPGPQELTGRVGMPLAFPIRASFDRGRTVGVIVAVLDWPSVVEILNGVKVVPEGQSERGYLVLADSSGVVLSAPPFFTGWQPGKTGLTSLGLEAVQRLPAGAAAGSATFDVRGVVVSGRLRHERAPAVRAGHVAHRAPDARRRRLRAAAAADVDDRRPVDRARDRWPPPARCTGRISSRARSNRSCRFCGASPPAISRRASR